MLSRRRVLLIALVLAGVAVPPVVVGLLATAAPAQRCDVPEGFAALGRLESADVVLMFRAVPAPIAVGRHFTVEAFVCATPPARGLRVDAQMPEHRHGMNYRPRVSATGDGRFVAEGFLLHMPGRWQLVFDVERDGRTERLVTEVTLE